MLSEVTGLYSSLSFFDRLTSEDLLIMPNFN